VNSLDGDVLEAYSSISCARRRWNRENLCYWICGVSKRSNRRKSSPVYRKTEGGRGRAAPGDEEDSSWEREAFQEKLP
jgi:hypothetical protein